MDIQKNYSLKAINSFGMDAIAANFARFKYEDELEDLIKSGVKPQLILGGGSNVLLSKDLPGLVLQNCIYGKGVAGEKEDTVLVRLGAGENWHEVVLWTLENNWGGIENLSLIPGSVGAAPIQNIGAYGVELKDVFHHLEAIDLETGKDLVFTNEECEFGYRDSIFKRSLKGKVCITRVCLVLQKKPEVKTHYGAIRQILSDWNITDPTIHDVSKAVIHIRQQKLPDPNELGNAGSFFKNPVIDAAAFSELKVKYPDIVSYPQADGKVKVPAGWLIERAGWKGKKVGNTGCHAKQALVIVNYGQATGQEIFNLAQQIMDSIRLQFNIQLQPEVNII